MDRATLSSLTSALLVIINYGASFSRFTHGEYTPALYAHQLDRVPDDPSTWFVPYIDLALATLVLYPGTRKVGLESNALFNALGLAMRIGQGGKDVVPDVGLLGLVLVALWAVRSQPQEEKQEEKEEKEKVVKAPSPST